MHEQKNFSLTLAKMGPPVVGNVSKNYTMQAERKLQQMNRKTY